MAIILIEYNGRSFQISLATVLYSMMQLLLYCAAAMQDVDNITLLNQPGVVGVWKWDMDSRSNKYSPLSEFRNETTRAYYDVWREDIALFQYPCEDRTSKLMLQNFTYSVNGGLIKSQQYYDLGIVYRYRPYWIRPSKCFDCWNKPLGFRALYCERGDIVQLYFVRAKKTVFQGAQFGVIMVLTQQAAFAIAGLVLPIYFRNKTQIFPFKKFFSCVGDLLRRLNWGATIVEWLHLLALAVAGYLLVEGYGHTDPHNWRTSAMNTLAYYYRVQTACAFVSSFLRQCANSMKLLVKRRRAAFRVDNDKHREMLIGQVVVCVVMVEYLYLADDDYLYIMIQVVFGVVAVAVTLSMSIVISVGCTSLWYIVKPVWKKMSAGMRRRIGGVWKKMSTVIRSQIAWLMGCLNVAAGGAAGGAANNSSHSPPGSPTGSSPTVVSSPPNP